MTLNTAIEYAIKVLEWRSVQPPAVMTDHITNAIGRLKDGLILDMHNRKLIAVSLFTHSMHIGPRSFKDTVNCAESIGVVAEMKDYIKSLNHYTNRCAIGKTFF